ncbi:MAG: hypothetical protein KDE33_07035 [Bacteroidetes bacterium]|nr:hypothetical protein [Bacteroidota bacterium]
MRKVILISTLAGAYKERKMIFDLRVSESLWEEIIYPNKAKHTVDDVRRLVVLNLKKLPIAMNKI